MVDDPPRDRSAFGFEEPHPDIAEFAQCVSCEFWLRAIGKCHYLRAQDDVDEDDSCIKYQQGEPNDDTNAKPTGKYAPKEIGFVSGKVRCENCNAFDDRDNKHIHCDLYVQLNRMFPRLFKLKEDVVPRACCNAQVTGERDPERFGPYGPIPDADDPKVGGLITRLLKRAPAATLAHGRAR